MGDHEASSDGTARTEWPRWIKALGYPLAVLALIATIVALGIAAVLLAS